MFVFESNEYGFDCDGFILDLLKREYFKLF